MLKTMEHKNRKVPVKDETVVTNAARVLVQVHSCRGHHDMWDVIFQLWDGCELAHCRK